MFLLLWNPESSVLFIQRPSIGPYHDPDKSRPHAQIYFFKIHINIILPRLVGSKCHANSNSIGGEQNELKSYYAMFSIRCYLHSLRPLITFPFIFITRLHNKT
jgi:hypothetical protein